MRELDEEEKIGTCGICGRENVIVVASGYYVDFVCWEHLQ